MNIDCQLWRKLVVEDSTLISQDIVIAFHYTTAECFAVEATVLNPNGIIYIAEGNDAIDMPEGYSLLTPTSIFHKGTTTEANTVKSKLVASDIGFEFFDTTLNKLVVFNGTNWIDGNGEVANIKHNGTFAQVPTPTNVGFQYFCTSGASVDGGTTEKTNIVIYYTGNGWVDANGNAVVAKA